jgi:CRISPR-associated protein Csm3
METEQIYLLGKLVIRAILQLEAGLHIGASKDYAPIGGIDNVFVRDPMTKQPVIPGSSVKGKMRTLLAKARNPKGISEEPGKDEPVVLRLFGSSEKGHILLSRLQFSDSFVQKESLKKFTAIDTDTYLGEVKFENSISRGTCVANPRQIERVPKGMQFDFCLVYNIEKEEELADDMKTLVQGFRLLRLDYLGGHGSRGYGRVSFRDFAVTRIDAKTGECKEEVKLKEMFERALL